MTRDQILDLFKTCVICHDWPIIGTPDQPGRAECKCRRQA